MATIAQNLAALQQARTDIAEAIENKGVTLEEGAGFTDFPQAIEDIPSGVDTSNDTVTPETLAEGITAHDASGKQIVGTGELKPVALELGLRVDFENKTFTRLGDAVGLNGGSDFDDFPMYKRRRCNLADDGTVNAYLGDENYKADGSNGQVMVEQPKFYYKVVPVKTTTDTSQRRKIVIAEYWVTDQPTYGYKVHPAFYNTEMVEIDKYYVGAYEGYVKEDKLISQSGAKLTDISTRSKARTAAANRGSGWRQETIWSWSAEQLLMLIEYGKFNMQEAIGNGYVYNGSVTLKTGTLDSYGNSSYGTTENETTAVQWRGKENPWGNQKTWVDGINIYGTAVYVARNYNFAEQSNYGSNKLSSNIVNYSSSNAYFFDSFIYDDRIDWIFMPYSLGGDSALPIGDGFILNANYSGWRAFMAGGDRHDSNYAGLFFIKSYYGYNSTENYVSARLLYVG